MGEPVEHGDQGLPGGLVSLAGVGQRPGAGWIYGVLAAARGGWFLVKAHRLRP